MSKKAVDAHCHLDFDSFDEDREEVIQKCSEKLEFVINSGRDFSSNKASLELQKKHADFIYATAGIHPTHTDKFDQVDRVKQQLKDLDFHAVGEIGMDFHHVEDEDMRRKQEKVFTELVDFAEKQDLPVVVHSRNAERQVIDILSDRDVEVYLHCFNGSGDLLKKAIEQGMLIGVTYQATYSSRVKEIVEKAGLENILIETDSPFLYRGERNTPRTADTVAEEISSIKDVEASKVRNITSRNAEQFFGLN